MPTIPVLITALPPPPSTGSPADFDTKADAFLGALPVHTTETNTLSTTNYTNAVEAFNSATTSVTQANLASQSASLALANASATLWVSGTTYALGEVVISPVDVGFYKRIIAGAGTTDPSLDTTNWKSIALGGLLREYVSGTTQVAVAGNNYWLTNVSATSVTAPVGADGDKFAVTPTNGLITNTVDFGAASVLGYAGRTLTGIISIDLGAPMEFEYSTTLTKWVMA